MIKTRNKTARKVFTPIEAYLGLDFFNQPHSFAATIIKTIKRIDAPIVSNTLMVLPILSAKLFPLQNVPNIITRCNQ
jgi:hypothetical protein